MTMFAPGRGQPIESGSESEGLCEATAPTYTYIAQCLSLGALSPRASALANLGRLDLCVLRIDCAISADNRRRRGGASSFGIIESQTPSLVLIERARPRSRAGAHHRVELHARYDARRSERRRPRPALRQRHSLCPMQRLEWLFPCATNGATSSARWRRQR
jgi:hypothetical protein